MVIKVILETDIGGDYDDFIALNMILTNPEFDLKAVLITPGYIDQIQITRAIFDLHGKSDIPIGSILSNGKSNKRCVGKVHFEVLKESDANFIENPNIQEGYLLFDEILKANPDLILITISPLKNFKLWHDFSNLRLKQSYSMGGYIGDPELNQPLTLPEFNFSGEKGGSHRLMNTNKIDRRVIVSKNITHHVFYTHDLHESVKKLSKKSIGFSLIYLIMERWFKKNSKDGILKKIHDPFTVCVALDESIVTLKEVQAYKENKKYGAHQRLGTNCFISYGNQSNVDFKKFYKLFLAN